MPRAWKLGLAAVAVFALGVGAGARLASADDAAPGARAYMEGVRRMDGQAVWDARSGAAQDQDARDLFYREHGAGVAMSDQDKRAYRERARQAEIGYFDAMRARGGRIDRVRYHGGHSNGTAGVYVFETVAHREGGDLDYVWAVVTDPQGKVLEVR